VPRGSVEGIMQWLDKADKAEQAGINGALTS
jgi:hypothetical protein